MSNKAPLQFKNSDRMWEMKQKLLKKLFREPKQKRLEKGNNLDQSKNTYTIWSNNQGFETNQMWALNLDWLDIPFYTDEKSLLRTNLRLHMRFESRTNEMRTLSRTSISRREQGNNLDYSRINIRFVQRINSVKLRVFAYERWKQN